MLSKINLQKMNDNQITAYHKKQVLRLLTLQKKTRLILLLLEEMIMIRGEDWANIFRYRKYNLSNWRTAPLFWIPYNIPWFVYIKFSY